MEEGLDDTVNDLSLPVDSKRERERERERVVVGGCEDYIYSGSHLMSYRFKEYPVYCDT